MKKKPTNFLRFMIILLGLAVMVFCVFALPEVWRGGPLEFPGTKIAIYLIVIGLYATALPFYVLLWQAFKLLKYIDHNMAFTEQSVKALSKIKLCASIISVLYLGGVPLLFPIAEVDDAPGLILVGFAISLVPLAVAVFASVLHKLFRNAIDIKSENDLTV